MKKLSVFEGLPQNLTGLATMPIKDFYKYAANLEEDPTKVWDMVDEAFETVNFFETVVH